MDTLCKYLDNIIQNPDEPKYQKIRCSNKVFQEKVAPIIGAKEFLQAAGFQLATMKPDPSLAEEEFWVFNAPEGVDIEDSVSMLTVRSIFKNMLILNEWRIKHSEITRLFKSGTSRYFKSHITHSTRTG